MKSKLRKKIERTMDFYCDRVGGGWGCCAEMLGAWGRWQRLGLESLGKNLREREKIDPRKIKEEKKREREKRE
jgi:hypothetical protein